MILSLYELSSEGSQKACIESTKINDSVFEFSQIKFYHVIASRRKHHILGVELNTLHGAVMVGVKDADLISKRGYHHLTFDMFHVIYLMARFSVPNMHSAISRTTEDKLGVGAEGRLEGYFLIVKMTLVRYVF